jgi:CO/xanthine dehydrogenase Mo-binding subunit
MGSVGRKVPRKEGPEKLCGLAKYIDDLPLPGCLHGVTLRSTVPHAKIKSLKLDPSFGWDGYVVATAADIPGENIVTLIEKDQPLLARDTVLHPMEPIALVAHAERDKAYAALSHIRVEYEPLEPVFDLEKSEKAFKSFLIEKGELEQGFASADFVVEGTYRVPHQEQAYIENNGVAAWFEPDGTLVVNGSLQCPYYVHKALKPIFGLDDAKVRVIQATTGGGFGGKEEYPNMIAGHAALLALKAKRPVKMIYDRHEDMAATTKRHPARVRVKTGITKDGRLTAQDVDVVMDGGAYATLSAVVLSRGTLHASGPYECPNVRVRSRVVQTHTPPNGAFRGFGAPQTLFAAELHWEKLADATGIDALELRRLNAFKLGSVTATGQTLKESVGALETLEKTVKRSGYERKRKSFDAWNKRESAPTWKGIGLALVHHGAGFTGSGEVYLASRAAVALTRDGEIRVDAASTEIGQGTNSMFAQIAADTLGIPYELVRVEQPDTARVPNSGPTVASRTCMIVGGLVRRACLQLKEKVGAPFPATREKLKAAAAGSGELRFEVEYEKPKEIVWDDATYKGDAYGVYSYGACAVELEIDKTTFEVRVLKLTTAQDIGKAIHPLLAEGQIMGGTTQGLGWALLEHPIYKDGVMVNSQFTNYIIPTALDTPPFDVHIVEKPYSRGPFGAKGVGELPMDVPAPAVAAAVRHATGALVTELPILPERIQAALSK